jgi:hypothetical protein
MSDHHYVLAFSLKSPCRLTNYSILHGSESNFHILYYFLYYYYYYYFILFYIIFIIIIILYNFIIFKRESTLVFAIKACHTYRESFRLHLVYVNPPANI